MTARTLSTGTLLLTASLALTGCGDRASTAEVDFVDGLEAYRLRRWEEAAGLLGRVLSAGPERPDVVRLRASALLHEGRLDEAEAGYDRAAELDPANCEACVGQGEVAYHRGRLAEADAFFEKAVSLKPCVPESVAAAWNGRALVARDRHNDALFRLGLLRALQADAGYAPAHYNLAYFHLAIVPDRTAALGHLRAFADRVDLADPYRAKGAEKLKKCETEAARDALAAEAAKPSAETVARLDAGYEALVAKKYDRALREFKAVLKADARNFSAQRGEAATLQRLGRKAEALAAYERAATLRPENADVRVEAAEIAFSLKKYALAETLLGAALARHPFDPVIHRRLAAVYHGLGRKEEARAYGAFALSLPDGKDPAFAAWVGSL